MSVHVTNTITFATDMVKTSVTVLPPDGYSDTRAVDIETRVFDGHDNRWLDARVTRLALTPEDLRQLGSWLQQQ
jgi:hypothetical protein